MRQVNVITATFFVPAEDSADVVEQLESFFWDNRIGMDRLPVTVTALPRLDWMEVTNESVPRVD